MSTAWMMNDFPGVRLKIYFAITTSMASSRGRS